MKIYNIKKNWEYWFFEEQEEFYEVLENTLNKGYQIIDSFHLCVEVKKDSHKIIFSFIEQEVVDETIKDRIKEMDKSYQLVYPSYETCILNTISSIRKSYNRPIYYDTDPKIDSILAEKKYKNIIIMLLDGLGENILDKHSKDNAFLKRYHSFTNTAIYPSTTAASTTSTKNGLAPICTGWLGWENYFKEIDRNIILFNGKNYFTEEPTGFNVYKALPYTFFYDDLDVNGSIIEPDFSKEERDFKEILQNSLKNLKKNRDNIQYVYFTDPDGLLHEFGTRDIQITKCIDEINNALEEYVSKLPSDTLLIISADHGHTDVKPIELHACKTIQKMLKRSPSNDSRCITFCVLDEYKESFMETFKALFGYAYDIYPSSELIDKEFFGKRTDVPSPYVKDFLADFVAVAKNEYYFNYKSNDNMVFKSHHAGITADEMLVPVIIYRK
ncbi:MAG: alkaline phosphatase family protein [Anaeroplasmataceae bacterium]|nr:alkaline phosphatase family protein [Anaeroplasmataceae bacterium]